MEEFIEIKIQVGSNLKTGIITKENEKYLLNFVNKIVINVQTIPKPKTTGNLANIVNTAKEYFK
jgi:hypothetical protein